MKQKLRQAPARRCQGKARSGSEAAGRPGEIARQAARAKAEPLQQLMAADLEVRPARRPRPPGPDTCHQFVRRQLAKALPELFAELVKRAQKGDVPTMKLLWQLAQLDKPAESGGGNDEDKKFLRSTLAKYGRC